MFSVSLLLIMAVQADPATSQATKPNPPKEKLICRREVPVGSLIASRKMCLTKTQWEQRAEIGNAVARRMVNENMGNMNVQ